jgi:hypothetical protein
VSWSGGCESGIVEGARGGSLLPADIMLKITDIFYMISGSCKAFYCDKRDQKSTGKNFLVAMMYKKFLFLYTSRLACIKKPHFLYSTAFNIFGEMEVNK